ncbi:carboxypeptidase M32 [Martelella lutilitoris]|uniref:Metal-dependent carboxypeptidase n=1 Tax=Martelella lutilitoris TaxID=2583532 RepID=A0A5C4JLY1_9HYPH|nr:carboxypeptidase M32 [Martelella lutilitoris]TNB46300.1 carboxypeptidase M32 [Martelella lutilitoris]
MTTSFSERIARLNDILCTVNVLRWDARVMMPAGGAASRGHQIATLQGLARDMLVDPAMADAAEEARAAAENDIARSAAEAVLRARDWHLKISETLLRRQAETSVIAGQAWARARAEGDFSTFQPYLEDVVTLSRQMADALGHDGHPYDPMVQIYEPGETAASLSALFDKLRAGIKPLLERALSRPAPRSDFLYRDYPIEAQKALCAELAPLLGLDMERSRLDTAVHPFEISFTRQDVRITSRWNPNYLPMSIFGTMHETGHALYEQGIDPALTRSAHATDLIGLYAVGGCSFGMHESQSRLFENHVGRSPAFWSNHFGTLRDHFPEQLADVSEEDFVAAINRVEPGLIRVEADELTYDLHIMLRMRIEMALMDGSLAVDDVPQAWNAAMRDDLGIDVPNDRLGCLQDIHWSSGYIGSFPTYTVGNITAAQLMARFDTIHPDLRRAADAGDLKPLREVLAETVWRHGRSKHRHELLAAIGTDADDCEPYIAYLRGKFAST